jgi:hypothetical protein
LWTCALAAWQVFVNGRHWTGTDGIYIVDQMQYLSWIRSASQHGLVSNLFVLRQTPADYFQPAVIISAALTRLGVPGWVALLVWKPVAVIGVFAGFRAYVRECLPGRVARRVALILALFFGCFSTVYGVFSIVGDVMPLFLSWGYTFGLLAIGLMALTLVLHARAREVGRLTFLPGILGAVATTLHPWQGELIGVIVLVSELVMWRARTLTRQDLKLALATLAPIGVALLYYLILTKVDINWRLARDHSKHAFSLWTIIFACLPLLPPAALAWRPRQLSYIAVVTRVWLFSAFTVWLVSITALGATPLHAFDGITLPLGVLAVEGVTRYRPERLPAARAILVAVLLVLTVPANLYLMRYEKRLAAPSAGNSNFISPHEADALHYLARNPIPGGVLTEFYLGEAVPAETGRHTFVGHCMWSQPGCMPRAHAAQALFNRWLSPAKAQAFVRASGARFLLDDCLTPGPSLSSLGKLVVSVHRFGCASVIELVAPAAPTGPLAESAPDAALRTPWRQ